MLYLMLVDEKGTIISLRITSRTFRIHLPGYEMKSREDSPLLKSKIYYMPNEEGVVNYASVVNTYEGKTELSLMEIQESSQYYSHMFNGEVRDFSSYSFSKEYSMLLIAFKGENHSAGNLQAIHIKNSNNSFYDIRKDREIAKELAHDSSQSAVLNYGKFLIFNRTQIASKSFGEEEWRIKSKIIENVSDFHISEVCLERMDELAFSMKKMGKEDSTFTMLKTALAFVCGIFFCILVVSVLIYKAIDSGYLRFHNYMSENPSVPQEQKILKVNIVLEGEIADKDEICSIWMVKLKETQEGNTSLNTKNKGKFTKEWRGVAIAPSLNYTVEGMNGESPEYYDDIVFSGLSHDKIQSIIQLYNCNHSFHKVCLENWLKYASSCPICRMTVADTD